MSYQPLDPNQSEAVPLPEQRDQSVYTPSPEVEALTPHEPEVFPTTAGTPTSGTSTAPADKPITPTPSGDTYSPIAPDNQTPLSPANPSGTDSGQSGQSIPNGQPAPGGTTSPTTSTVPTIPTAPTAPSVSVSADGQGGMIIAPQGGVVEQITLHTYQDPFDTPNPTRQASRDLFKPQPTDRPPDSALLQQFVTPQRMRDLWHQIDALQEEVIQRVQADRTDTDTYQQDLLYASSLLLQSTENYDEAREIVYRVRGDLNRQARVVADIKRYRPALVVYYLVWLVAIFVAARLDPQFRQIVPENLPILKLSLLPILFAAGGALFNGFMALIDHTTRKMDFDPIYNTWYILNPLIGGVLGLVVFVFFVVTGTSFNPNLINDQAVADAHTPLTIWLLAFIVGWQQNTAIKLLNGFLKTVTTDKTDSTSSRPSASGGTGAQ